MKLLFEEEFHWKSAIYQHLCTTLHYYNILPIIFCVPISIPMQCPRFFRYPQAQRKLLTAVAGSSWSGPWGTKGRFPWFRSKPGKMVLTVPSDMEDIRLIIHTYISIYTELYRDTKMRLECLETTSCFLLFPPMWRRHALARPLHPVTTQFGFNVCFLPLPVGVRDMVHVSEKYHTLVKSFARWGDGDGVG